MNFTNYLIPVESGTSPTRRTEDEELDQWST